MENTSDNQNNKGTSLWSIIKIISATLLSLFILLVIIKNWYNVDLDLVFKSISTPLTAIILISVVTGYIWGTMISYRRYIKRKKVQKAEDDSIG